ncbi:MAG: prepilin-type N-terminal cleavage/methylation domain-containing protein [Candidatus Eremiobacteraeota bacterium]|nr:prepilin-type N-terminal cleavage/methylation domain-containing protein [Candidatus Eremiobacteraeota bacterium]
MKTARRGFTLVELIVAIAVAGIIMAIAVPQYIGYKSRLIAKSEALKFEAFLAEAKETSKKYCTSIELYGTNLASDNGAGTLEAKNLATKYNRRIVFPSGVRVTSNYDMVNNAYFTPTDMRLSSSGAIISGVQFIVKSEATLAEYSATLTNAGQVKIQVRDNNCSPWKEL